MIVLKRTGKATRIHRSSSLFDPSRRRCILKLFYADKIGLHITDYTYLGPHHCSNNIRILSVSIYIEEKLELAQSQYHLLPPINDGICWTLGNDSGWASPEWAKKFRILAHCANFLGPIKYCIKTCSVRTQHKIETLLGEICSNNGVFAELKNTIFFVYEWILVKILNE